jgi:putative ABC transport system permease protein
MITKLTIKQLAANKLRLLATAFAVILGVAFLAGTLILTDTIKGTLDSALANADAGTDAYIRGTSPLTLGYGQSGRPVDATLLQTVRNVDGVDRASIEVLGYAQILDKHGKAVGSANAGVHGRNWVTVPDLNPFTINSGRPPTGPDEIAIDKRSADLAGFHVGDKTTVLSTGEPRQATIVGIVRFGSLDTPGASSVVLFDDVTAQAVLNQPGKVDAITVTARHGVSPDTLVARLAPVVGSSNQVISGAQLTKEHQDQIGKAISQFGTFLTLFALIALFVGAFIINNTFSIIVSQRTKEMALLRAVGATGRQVRMAVLAEAAVTGLVASAVGLVAGIGVAKGIRSLLSALGVDIPLGTSVVTTATVTVSIVVGLVITVVSAVMPARRASKVAPIAALRDVAQDRSAVSRRRIVTGAAAIALAVTTLLVGLNAANAKIVGIGAVALFLAVSVIGPVLARPVAAVLGAPIARLRGTAGVIARQNAMRNPKRTAGTAASLMIGVALVSFITIFAASIKSSGAGAFRHDFHGTTVVDSGAIDGNSGFSPELAASLSANPSVDSIAEQRNTAVEINGQPDVLSAYDTATISTMFDLGNIEGDLSHLGADGIAVKAETGPNAVKLGDTRTIAFPTGTATFTVRATYDHRAAFFGDQFVDLSAFEARLPMAIDARIYVNAADIEVVDRAAATYPTAKVLTTEAFITEQNGNIDIILKLVYALLGLAVIIALLGIANTLALSIHERKRELGLLRAVGMSRAQVRSSVRWESAIIALFGTVLGLAVGAFLGWAMVHAIATQGIDRLVIPVGSLVTVASIAAVAGVGAALMPARRAARTDILGAIATG